MLSSNYSTVEQGAKAVLLPGLLLLPVAYVVVRTRKDGLGAYARAPKVGAAGEGSRASKPDNHVRMRAGDGAEAGAAAPLPQRYAQPGGEGACDPCQHSLAVWPSTCGILLTLARVSQAHSASEADLRQSITDQHLQDTIRVSDPGAAHVHAVRDSVYNSF